MILRLYQTCIILFLTIILFIFVKRTTNKKLIVALTLSYLFAILVLTVFSRDYNPDRKVNYDPFHMYIIMIKRLYKRIRNKGMGDFLKSLSSFEYKISERLLNVLLFMPLGYLLPVVSNRFRFWWKVLLLGAGFSLLIEMIQFITYRGFCDTSDILHNSLGAWVGFFLWWKWMRRTKCKQKQYSVDNDSL